MIIINHVDRKHFSPLLSFYRSLFFKNVKLQQQQNRYFNKLGNSIMEDYLFRLKCQASGNMFFVALGYRNIIVENDYHR